MARYHPDRPLPLRDLTPKAKPDRWRWGCGCGRVLTTSTAEQPECPGCGGGMVLEAGPESAKPARR